ncbi:D-alanine--D-alanine ligase [uncultured Lutibacter sp.]|uniref:D-alanine--D-alanine ligase n=1 Tax=uncultured Lutibacter sp. TaxID=437739 RepID=UPI0026373125|nr:D-alanine--D-alanine ligase [uncultured Lutibacter sp.]
MKFLNYKKNANWEYWPSFMFYLPVVPYACYLALKTKSFGFFSAVNPAIEGSGNGLESKYNTVQLLPEKYKPTTIFIKKGDKTPNILTKLTTNTIKFPLIIKPDIGFRGLLVKKINSEKELLEYLQKYNSINLIIQEFIDYKNECGIFYHRIPGEKTGKITSITLKKYLTVVGNGTSSILELILNDDRAYIYIDLISELNKDKLHTIPFQNEEIVLNNIGNHSKGTQFINGNHLISKELTNSIDILNNSIKGWYYGRLDIKYNSFDELIKGENFKIIEINGVISEPTHIYDASKGSYFDALKAIKDHWKLIYIIAINNKKLNNERFTNLKYLIKVYFNYKKYLKKVSDLSTK